MSLYPDQRRVKLLQSYATAFPLTEDPISEGGLWIGGFTVGLDWEDVATTGGLAAPSQTSHVHPDQTALLTGTWGPNIRITGVAKHNPVATTNFRELEFRLRSSLSAHVNNGYEINFGIGALHPYIEVVRWNGPVDTFDYVTQMGAVDGVPEMADGDTMRVDMRGTIIQIFVNGAQIGPNVDVSSIGAHFDTGNPGIGFYNDVTTAYGWKSLTVQEL